mmetsp:Transcript_93789/g.244378  ORF Transcript_93789/g.244378 Transcript_93789/m.244378 type:complete len:305 (+) Transcript_93789:1308-2222(+)
MGLRLGAHSQLLLLEGGLQRRQLGLLGCHELLERLLGVCLLHVRLFQVGGERVVQALQHPLDPSGLGRVITERVVVDSQERGPARAREHARGLGEEAAHDVEVLLGDPARRGCFPEHLLHSTRDADELRLLDGLQEALLALARAAEGPDGGLQGTDALLGLRLLALVVAVLAPAHVGGLALLLLVVRDELLEVGHLRAVRGDLASELLDLLLQAVDLLLRGGDVRGLAGEGVLAPTCILVVGAELRLALHLKPHGPVAHQLRDRRHRGFGAARPLLALQACQRAVARASGPAGQGEQGQHGRLH